MPKIARNIFIGALLVSAISGAYATNQGAAPNVGDGFELIDGRYILGLAGGINYSFQSGITAAGTNQATATQIGVNIALVEVDTTASSTGVALPQCFAGISLSLYNNGAQTLTVYPNPTNNPKLAAGTQDTINNGTSTTIATHVVNIFSCAKNGVWSSK
jgi:hypothetical protein